MPARKCTVALLGGGPRGVDHAQAFLDNPERFEFVAICDRDPEKLAGLSRLTGGVGGYADAATMLAAHRPDVFCFVTPPSIRLPLLQLGLEHGARAIAFEKPVSLRIDETRAMAALLEQSRVRAVVSQQIKYRSTWRQAKRWLDAGEIGRLHTMQASSGVWHMQHGPHLTEYMSFFNDHHPIAWVHGTSFGGGKLDDSHPSPDFSFGQLAFENGVRGFLSLGELAPAQPGNPSFWQNAGITLQGDRGFIRVTFAGYLDGVLASSGYTVGSIPTVDAPVRRAEQREYIADLARCLDAPDLGHPCDARIALRNNEAVLGLLLSGIEQRKVVLPLPPGCLEPIPFLQGHQTVATVPTRRA